MLQLDISHYFDGIEAGGTKFVCAIGTDRGEIVDEVRFPTRRPDETIGQAIDFFRKRLQKYNLSSIGIGSFGPIDLNPQSSTCGYITSTPKAGWQNVNFGPRVSKELSLPFCFDTDVNAAALAEHKWGAARGCDTFIYITIGTGIGGGGMSNGKLMHGLGHPEMGHCFISADTLRDQYKGKCPYHGNKCFEGLASGSAIAERWGTPGDLLPKNHEAWLLEAHYIA